MAAPLRVSYQQPALVVSQADAQRPPPPAYDGPGSYEGQVLPPVPQSSCNSIANAVSVLSPDRVSNPGSGIASSRDDEARIKAIASAAAGHHRYSPLPNPDVGFARVMGTPSDLEYAAKDGDSRAHSAAGGAMGAARNHEYAAKAADVKAIAAAAPTLEDDVILIQFCWNLSFSHSGTPEQKQKFERGINVLCGGTDDITVKANKLRSWLSADTFVSTAREVYATSLRLSRIPPEISYFRNVTTLDLDNNNLTSFPLEILSLRNLVRLVLRNNQLSQLPAQISQMTNLEALFLDNNKLLAKLPKELYQLPKLRTLSIIDTRISFEHLQQYLPALRTLTSLSVNDDLYKRFATTPRMLPENCTLRSR